jgi:hypothetical protein
VLARALGLSVLSDADKGPAELERGLLIEGVPSVVSHGNPHPAAGGLHFGGDKGSAALLLPSFFFGIV